MMNAVVSHDRNIGERPDRTTSPHEMLPAATAAVTRIRVMMRIRVMLRPTIS